MSDSIANRPRAFLVRKVHSLRKLRRAQQRRQQQQQTKPPQVVRNGFGGTRR
jgi:hypothetical protein